MHTLYLYPFFSLLQISHDDDNAVSHFVSILLLDKHTATGLEERHVLGKEVVLSVGVVTCKPRWKEPLYARPTLLRTWAMVDRASV